MTQAQLLYEFRQLSLPQQLETIQAALGILAEHFPMSELRGNGNQGNKALTEAANLLLADYVADQALTSFTALDGDPFMERGEVWLINLDPTVGAEIKKTRSAVIVNDDGVDVLPLRVIVPLTDWKDRYQVAPWMVRVEPATSNGLAKISAADIHWLR